MDNPKSIAELWSEFQKLFKIGKRNPLYWSKVWDKTNLRSELLERCKELEDDAAICVTVAEFEVVQEDDQAFIERDMLAITLSGPFAAEPSKLREFAAILNFWAWELEQRAKEVSNG